MFRRLRRLTDLSPGEAALLPLLALASVTAQVGIRLGTLPAVTRAIQSLRRLATPARGLPPTRLYALADLAARITRGPDRCLPRSLLLFGLLKNPVELRIGVRQETSGLEGHAWVQQDGLVMGDPPDTSDRFTEILKIRAS